MSINVNVTFLSRSLTEAEAALSSIVRERGEQGARFKVGISVNPPRRIIGNPSPLEEFFGKPRKYGMMNRDYRWGVTNIYFLFHTDDHGECQEAERRLIRTLWDIAGEQALNENDGGGGPRHMSGTRYVYLAHSAG